MISACKEESVASLHRQLIEGRADVPRVGSVVELESIPRYAVLDADGSAVAPVVPYLRGLILDDNRPLTAKSYAYDLLRWYRLLWFLGVPWDRATEAEASALVGWLRVAPNPQRRRRNPNAPQPGVVNHRTGKPYLKAGYAPSTINHCLTVVSSFYAYHRHYGRGPLVNRSRTHGHSAGPSLTGPRTVRSLNSGGPDSANGSGGPIPARFPTRCVTSSSGR
jgi:hypothetical protein